MYLRMLTLLALLLGLAGCAQFAVWMTAKSEAKTSTSPLARQAKSFFWQTLHHNKKSQLEQAEQLLMRAYLENPHDPVITAYIAFIHIWKLTERDFKHPNPLVINEIHLAQDYFSKALDLDPKNPIYLGFLGDTYLVEGQVLKNKRKEVQGYFMLKDAIEKWPEFNYFTAGYPMSTLAKDDPHFKEALEWQWNTLDVCAGVHVDRQNPSFAPYMHLATKTGRKRACWNSWAAPHNFEGFFMNMGDMLVKSGDWKTAIQIYENAKLSKTYASWPYKNALEARIKHAQKNNQPMLFNSGYGCMACHQL